MMFEWFGIMNVNVEGYFEIGGVDILKFIEKYGMLFYVYDVVLICDWVRGFKKIFEELGVKV